MRTFADKIVACTTIDPVISKLRDLLVRPSTNHSTEVPRAFFDRYVVQNSDHVFIDSSLMSDDEYLRMVSFGRLPHANMWMEWRWRSAEGTTQIGVVVRDGIEAHAFLSYIDIPQAVMHIGSFSPVTMKVIVSRHRHDLNLAANQFSVLLAAITSSRAATTERVISGNAVSHLATLRKFQRGAPVFSHNLVNLILPETSSQNHSTKRGPYQGTVRAHNVRGHWRLILGDGAAYFTWVDGHVAGNMERGFVSKTHVMKIDAAAIRNGYAVPRHTGKRRDRVRAVMAT